MDSNYLRVIPRDLFNEAKLLKCLGRLVILIDENNTIGEPNYKMEYYHDQLPFDITLDEKEGVLLVSNLEISINSIKHRFVTNYNSKQNYPLLVENKHFDDLDCEFYVFDEEGNFSEDFKNYLNRLRW